MKHAQIFAHKKDKAASQQILLENNFGIITKNVTKCVAQVIQYPMA